MKLSLAQYAIDLLNYQDEVAAEFSSLRRQIRRLNREIGDLKRERVAVIASETIDDLTKIEGIGKKVAELLNQQGISNYASLASSTPQQLRKWLEAAGIQNRVGDPADWPARAAAMIK